MSHNHDTDGDTDDDVAFWLENPLVLFSSCSIAPDCCSSTVVQLNAAARGCLLMGLVLHAVRWKYAAHVSVLGLLLTVIIFYGQINSAMVHREPYSNSLPMAQTAPPLPLPIHNAIPMGMAAQLPSPNKLRINDPTTYRFCLDQRAITPNNTYYSRNQALTNQVLSGGDGADANLNAVSQQVYNGNSVPNNEAGSWRTRVAPLVTAPMFASEYWSENYIVPHGINSSTNTELYQSGYMTTTPNALELGLSLKQAAPVQPTCANYQPPFNPTVRQSNAFPIQQTHNLHPASIGGGAGFREGFAPMPASDGQPMFNAAEMVGADGVETIKRPGDLWGCNYNPELLQRDLPVNASVGACETNVVFDAYNKNLYTQTIEPGVYSQQQVQEYPLENMGITTALQFPPMTCRTDAQGNRIFVSQDPRTTAPVEPIPRAPEATVWNVTDPRSFGSGASDRCYVDPLLGSPMFVYSDVDSIRRPNYITRSHVDMFPWADKYGPMTSDTSQDPLLYRSLGLNQFLNGTLALKTELQERYQRKFAAQGWQRRQAPHGARQK